VSLAIASGSLR